MDYIDIAYSPIYSINNIQRIIKPIKSIKPIYGKRTIKHENDYNKIIRINKLSIKKL